jgi:chromosome segregation ATPase
MAHDRNVAKLTKDMQENSERLQEQLKTSHEQGQKELADLQTKYDELLKQKDNNNSKTETAKDDNERCQELEKQLAEQKGAYEVLLDTIKEAETNAENMKEQKEELEGQLKALQEMNKEVHQQNLELEEKVDTLEKGQGKEPKGGLSRNSINSDGDEYKTVEEMREHLKHARQLLGTFIQKLPYS